jgi:hypothetical protein
MVAYPWLVRTTIAPAAGAAAALAILAVNFAFKFPHVSAMMVLAAGTVMLAILGFGNRIDMGTEGVRIWRGPWRCLPTRRHPWSDVKQIGLASPFGNRIKILSDDGILWFFTPFNESEEPGSSHWLVESLKAAALEHSGLS